MPDKPEKINRIKVVLSEKDMTMAQLAKLVDRNPDSISRICRNESQPTLKLLKKIALALDVDIKDLLISTK
ncbi:MAG: helix-turn-helix transcriptional regulator [Bacteroidetes bacterium]|nr:helix-turn-helix transcriptional regulator [Bacteroidota bacterium]MBI3136408.1 helix-turn-helix transcriptional regulator [Bacteroidota bacterium]